MKTLQFFGNNITELYICHGFNKFIGNLDLHNLKKYHLVIFLINQSANHLMKYIGIYPI